MEINVNKFEVCGVWERKRKMCWQGFKIILD